MAQAVGIDVSHFQGAINWQKVHDTGISFAFIKATQGVKYVDPTFTRNWQSIGKIGLLRGAYHFFAAGVDARAQAQNFIRTVRDLGENDLPPVLDVEDRQGIQKNRVSKASLVSGVRTWLDIVENALDYTPIIYSDPSFWRQYMTPEFGDYPLWIANYDVKRPIIPGGWDTYAFWQYTQTGRINGIASNVDLNVFNGTVDDLIAFIAPIEVEVGGSEEEESSGQQYTVRSGDTLSAISRRFGVSVQDIMRANRLSNANISVGDTLVIP